MMKRRPTARRGTILLMIVGLLAMLFMIVTAYITLARFDRQALAQTANGARVEQIVRSILDVLVGQIADSLTDANGRPQVGGPAYQPIPGGEGTPWLASSEPLRQGGDPTDPEAYGYPALTAVGGGPATDKGLKDIAFDHPTDGDRTVTLRQPGAVDRIYNARRGFMDAAGTGIADSWFGDGTGDPGGRGVGLLTELANAMDGRVVRARGFNPARVEPTGDTEWLAFDAFDNAARFLTAARVVSHGGMLQIGLPDASVAWNREFVLGMFRWVRNPRDGTALPSTVLLEDAWAERAAVEPQLRSRLGLVIGGNRAAVPGSLTTFEKNWPWTFVPGGLSNPRTQRFNLATEWNVFRQAATIDADEFNGWLEGVSNDSPRAFYTARQLMTVSNTSDELARVATRLATQPGEQPGLYPGQLKYYLGRIAAAFDPVTGNFVSDGNGSQYDGYEVVRDLASYYYEMLKEYRGWRDEGAGGAAVSRLEQAYMLAVNTVAFAAPRDAVGKIDLVYHRVDPSDPNSKVFVGYAPQPFFTQAVAYNKVGEPLTPGGEPPNHITVAVELFYPHETLNNSNSAASKWDAGGDPTALNLSQFAISVSGGVTDGGSVDLRPLDVVFGQERLAGGRFVALTLHDGNNSAWGGSVGPNPGQVDAVLSDVRVATLEPAADGRPKRIEVQLWRRGKAPSSENEWVLVDRLAVPLQRNGAPVSESEEWLAGAQRDTRSLSFLGPPGGPPVRWRMAVGAVFNPQRGRFERQDDFVVRVTAANKVQVLQTALESLNSKQALAKQALQGPGEPEESLALADPSLDVPAVPLYTMNAGAGLWNFSQSGANSHVGVRPASFPTVGFLHFVPRFSHMISGGTNYAMSEILGEQLARTPGGSQQADFGHMPIFTNRQELGQGSGFEPLGRVPWGLLVYDYFTTLDPRGPDAQWNTADDVDPYRVLGRIDINAAPWHMLAGLPVIGPLTNGDLPLPNTASPAFRLASARVLTSPPNDGTPRFMSNDPRLIRPTDLLGQGWWRLGPYLAQAAAAYRDRLHYALDPSPQLNWLLRAKERNAGQDYRPSGYGPIRSQRGFVTIGELVNVIGFDGSSDTELGGGPDATVLGGYGRDQGGDFIKAVSLMALLDTQYLTTRSNTYTIYTTLLVNDPDDPQASVRAQVTIDRSNLLPRLVMDDLDGDGFPETPRLERVDTDGDGNMDRWAPVIIRNTGPPEMLGRHEIAYFNTRHDE